MDTIAILIPLVVVTAGAIATFFRWLRVAQREHYIPGSTSRFSTRWWTTSPLNIMLALGALVGAAFAIWTPWSVLVTGTILTIGPGGLTLRGRSAPLVWTRRLRLVAIVAGSLMAILAALGSGVTTNLVPIAAVALATPALIDLALLALRPVEKHIAQRYVRKARKRLDTVRPVVVAITGSYGKTTTKEYVKHLVTGARTVVASPASFNNTAGLCRTINEHLSLGVDVLIAEVGTYGKGEITEICRWLQPKIGAITAIGPVHLERMGSLDNIAEAKAEIIESVESAILNTDYPHLRELASNLSADKVVFSCGSDTDNCYVAATAAGDAINIHVAGKLIATVENQGFFPGNLAIAVAIALALNVSIEHIVQCLDSLPTPSHRQQVITAQNGIRVIDDTFNSNPAGAAHALTLLSQNHNGNRRVVISPGMVELGHRQRLENEKFARNAAMIATDLLIVGRTNLASMRKGAQDGNAKVWTFGHRNDAVKWVRENLAEGDVVLYENDLPDHFP